MKKVIVAICLLNLSGNLVAQESEAPKDREMSYLKDNQNIHNIRLFRMPTLFFKKDIDIKNNEHNYFQNGKQISENELNPEAPYCSLIVVGRKDMFAEELPTEDYKIKEGSRMMIQGPLTHINTKAELNFDEKAMKISGVKSRKREYTIDLLANKGIATSSWDEISFSDGFTSKRLFQDEEIDKESINGSLKCYKFSTFPTVGDVKNILGAKNITMMPDKSELQAYDPVSKMFVDEDIDSDREAEDKAEHELIKNMNAQITALIEMIGSEEVQKQFSDIKGKSKSINQEKLMEYLQNEAQKSLK